MCAAISETLYVDLTPCLKLPQAEAEANNIVCQLQVAGQVRMVTIQ
jgi:hypothetical protein